MIHKFFQCSQLQACTENIHSLLQFLHGRQAGGDTQVGILGILAVGVCSAGIGQHHTCALAQLVGALSTAVHGIKADKVAAARAGPLSNARAAKLLGEDTLHCLKLGANKRRLTLHTLRKGGKPRLLVKWENGQKEIIINTTGTIQLEVLDTLLSERLGLRANFSQPTVIYKETPAREGIAYADYLMPKPCWAIVKFRFEPMPRGYGNS